MSHLRALPRTTAAAAAAFAVLACSDVMPSSPDAPRLNAETPPPAYVKVCKEGPAGVYNFTAVSEEGYGTLLVGTPVPNPDGHGTIVNFQVAAGSCLNVYQVGADLEAVIISEIGPMPDGVELDFITYQQQAFGEEPAGAVQTLLGSNSLVFEPFPKPWVVTFFNKRNETPGIQGCTPGFWKNSVGSWAATGYAPTDDFDTVFGVNAFNPDVTLMQAVRLNGGGINALARHAVAGLLAAAHPDVDYTLSSAQIIADVQSALANGTVETTKNMLDRYNNQGCPLANDNSF